VTLEKNMATKTRLKRWLLAAGALGVLSLLLVLLYMPVTPVVPVAQPQLANPAPAVAATPRLAPRPASAVPAGVRSDYIVQAASVELARRA